MWISTTATMKFEPQPCIARRNQPSGSCMVQHLQAVPGLARRGNIDDGQQDAGDDL